jgi:WD40 repeat protein
MAGLIALCSATALGLAASWAWQVKRERQHAYASALSARLHADELRREAEATRRRLYAVEMGRAYDARENAQIELARQILDRQRPRPGEDDLRGFEWGYLWTLCNRELTLRGHQGRIVGLEFSPDSRILATGSVDRTIKLWDTSDWNELATLTGHEREVADLAFSPDGRELYSTGFDGTVRRWDVHARQPKDILWRGPGAIFALALSPDGKSLAFCPSVPIPTKPVQLYMLDLATGSLDDGDVQPSRATSSLAYSPDGTMLAEAGGPDHLVHIWDPCQHRVRNVLTGHDLESLDVCFSPDGKCLATTGAEGTVRVWDPATGRELARQSGLPSVTAPTFSPDGRILAVAHAGEVMLWELATQNVRKAPAMHLGRVSSLSFSPNQKVLASGGRDGMVRLWDPKTLTPLPTPANHLGTAAVAGQARPETLTYDGTGEFPNSMAVAPDGESLAVGGSEHSVQVWDVRSGTVRLRLPDYPSRVHVVFFFPDSRTLALGGNDQWVRLYDTTSGRERLVLSESDHPPRPVWSLALTPDERFLITGTGTQGEPGRVVIWDLSTGRVRAELRGHSDYVRAAALAPDGRTLFSGSGDETIKVWDFASGAETATLEGHRGQVFCLALDPTGRLLASGSEDYTVRLWDVAARREAAALRGHVDAVHSVAFTPDGTRLASAGRDGSVYLWDVATRRRVGNLTGHTARVNQVRFFPDGKTLVSASVDRTIRFWYADSSSN